MKRRPTIYRPNKCPRLPRNKCITGPARGLFSPLDVFFSYIVSFRFVSKRRESKWLLAAFVLSVIISDFNELRVLGTSSLHLKSRR